MYQSFYLSVDPIKMEQQWQLPLASLKEEFLQTLPKSQEENWAMLSQRAYKVALEPQFKFLERKYGKNLSLHEITEKLSVGIVSVNGNTDWRTRELDPKIYELVRIQSLYRALLLMNHQGLYNYPITHHIGDDYFLAYLEYRANIKNFLQYDPRIRKNFIEFMFPPELKDIIPNVWEHYEVQYLFHCPVLLNANLWSGKWDKLNAIPDFWRDFKIVNDAQNQDENLDFGLSIDLARSKKQRKYKLIHKDDLLQKYLEKAWPKYPDVESPEFREIALTHLKAIGEIAAYAEQNQLLFVKFYI
jgi:hypothetical protein